MKALAKVNNKSVGLFYNMTDSETKAEMHQRIYNVLVYRYGICNINIEFLNN